MNAEMILNELYQTSVKDPAVHELATQLEALIKSFQRGELSADELQELLVDFKTQQLIMAQCSDMASKERLNSIINVVINVGSALSSV
jgi:hypothetical protein